MDVEWTALSIFRMSSVVGCFVWSLYLYLELQWSAGLKTRTPSDRKDSMSTFCIWYLNTILIAKKKIQSSSWDVEKWPFRIYYYCCSNHQLLWVWACLILEIAVLTTRGWYKKHLKFELERMTFWTSEGLQAESPGCLGQWEEVLVLWLEFLSFFSSPSFSSLSIPWKIPPDLYFSSQSKVIKCERTLRLDGFIPSSSAPSNWPPCPHPPTPETLSSWPSFQQWIVALHGIRYWLCHRPHCSHSSENTQLALHGPPKLPQTSQLRFKTMVCYGWR